MKSLLIPCDRNRRNWLRVVGKPSLLLPFCAALVAISVFISLAFCQRDTELFAVLFITPGLILIGIGLLVYAIITKHSQKRLTLLFTVAAVWVTSVAMLFFNLKYDSAIRATARWLIWSSDYKAQVLAQPPTMNGDFKHIEWDGWGFVGAGDNTVYLVFDPSDSLYPAAASGQPGKFFGIPCAVFQVKRFEAHWYTAQFYTDQDWTHCD